MIEHATPRIRAVVGLIAFAVAACGPAATTTASGSAGSTAITDLAEDTFSPDATRAAADVACPTVARPYLWRVDPPATAVGAEPSYLFGTMHIGIALAKEPPVVLDAFDGARVAVFETPADDTSEPGAGFLPPQAPSLEEQLGASHWGRFASLVGGRLAHSLRRAEPSTAAVFLMALYLDQTVSLDGELMQRAAEHGIPIEGLETDAFQATLLARWLDLRALRASIIGASDRRELQREASVEVAEYCAGTDDDPGMDADDRADLMAVGYSAAELDQFEEDLLYSRNRAWIPKLEDWFGRGGVFVTVGADHLRGPAGVVQTLAERGWRVTRIEGR